MAFLILRYILAAPFAMLWAVCLTGNTWLLLTTLATRPRHTPTPVAVIGLVSGLISLGVAPLSAHVDWRVLLGAAALPEGMAILLALIGVVRGRGGATDS